MTEILREKAVKEAASIAGDRRPEGIHHVLSRPVTPADVRAAIGETEGLDEQGGPKGAPCHS